MVTCTSNCFLNVINLANSIIGVSILAMPYCFQKCGILLSLLLILVSGFLVRIACYLLLKCAIMARRRNFEYLAFHALGSTGKLAVEIGIIGFLIGVCIAFFVVIGDLGPPLASQYMMVENTSNLRVQVLVFLGLFVALPLGMLKNVNSLTSLSAFSIAFYGWLILKIFSEAVSKLAVNEWWHQVNWWQMDGFLPCLPIFSMALSCQTQLFEFFDTLSEPSVKRMMTVVNGAVYLCSAVYILVGFFGYIACHDQTITGNVLVNLTPSIITECIKIFFVVTIVISFPLCLFPCRTSLHSLLFKQGLGHHEIAGNIPDQRFRVLTISLVIVTISVAIMIPNIEFALGLIGSTIGTMICLIFPAIVFIHDTNKNTTEKRLAQIVLFVGIFMLFACTYSTLQEGTQSKSVSPAARTPDVISQSVMNLNLILTSSEAPVEKVVVEEVDKDKDLKNQPPVEDKDETKDIKKAEIDNEKRQEPPVPREPEVVQPRVKIEPKVDLDPQALQKEDKEIQKETLQQNVIAENNDDASLKEKQEQILQKLEEQQKQQKIIIEEQKRVLEELKLHRDIHEEEAKEKKQLEKNSLDALKSVNEQEQVDRSLKQIEKPVEALNKRGSNEHLVQVSEKPIEVKSEAVIKEINSSSLNLVTQMHKQEGNFSAAEPPKSKDILANNGKSKITQSKTSKKEKSEAAHQQFKPDVKDKPVPVIDDTLAKKNIIKKELNEGSLEKTKYSNQVDLVQNVNPDHQLKPNIIASPAEKNRSELHAQSKRSPKLPDDNDKHEM